MEKQITINLSTKQNIKEINELLQSKKQAKILFSTLRGDVIFKGEKYSISVIMLNKGHIKISDQFLLVTAMFDRTILVGENRVKSIKGENTLKIDLSDQTITFHL